MKDFILPLVSMYNANFIDLPLGEGFGFNGNILETNILNLAVVLGVVISFGGDALRSLLETRRQTILNNLQQAEKRASEAQQKLAEAKYQLEAAQKRALEIQKQGNINAEKEKKDSINQTKEDVDRLEQNKDENLRLQQQKAVGQVSQKVLKLALTQVKEKLANRLDSTFHTSVNNFNIVLFTNYRLK